MMLKGIRLLELGAQRLVTSAFANEAFCLLSLGGQGFLMKAEARFDSAMALLLLTASAVLILKSFGFRGAPLVVALTAVCVVSSYESALSEIFGLFNYLGNMSDGSEYISSAIKVVGISYLSGISADVCREIGESGVAKCISLVTKFELILISVPYIKQILSSLISLAEA